jgi:hypothetical protein
MRMWWATAVLHPAGTPSVRSPPMDGVRRALRPVAVAVAGTFRGL